MLTDGWLSPIYTAFQIINEVTLFHPKTHGWNLTKLSENDDNMYIHLLCFIYRSLWIHTVIKMKLNQNEKVNRVQKG